MKFIAFLFLAASASAGTIQQNGGVAVGAVTSTNIAAGAVDTAKIGSGAVDTTKLKRDAVTSTAILHDTAGAGVSKVSGGMFLSNGTRAFVGSSSFNGSVVSGLTVNSNTAANANGDAVLVVTDNNSATFRLGIAASLVQLGANAGQAIAIGSKDSSQGAFTQVLRVDTSNGRVGIGTDTTPNAQFAVEGDTFTVTTGGIVSAPSNPHVRVTPGTNQFATATASKMFFKANAIGALSGKLDYQNMWGGTASSGTITVPASGAGWYRMRTQFYSDVQLNRVDVEIRATGNVCQTCVDYVAHTNGYTYRCDCEAYLNAGDTVQVYMTHNRGSDFTGFSTSDAFSDFTVTKIW